MTATTSRRAVLAGAVSLPVLATPVAATTTFEIAANDPIWSDPAFAAIKEWERLRKISDDAFTAASRISDDAASTSEDVDRAEEFAGDRNGEELAQFAALIATTPTTIEGCIALLDSLQEFVEFNACEPFRDWPKLVEAGGNLFGRLATALNTCEA